MDRPTGMRLEEELEGQQPPKDALPCYVCAINNLENCTHNTVNNGVNANAESIDNSIPNSIAPVHHGGRDLPPSYRTACSPELASHDNVAVTVEDQQRTASTSDNLARDCAADPDEAVQERKLRCAYKLLAIVFVIIPFWIIRMWL